MGYETLAPIVPNPSALSVPPVSLAVQRPTPPARPGQPDAIARQLARGLLVDLEGKPHVPFGLIDRAEGSGPSAQPSQHLSLIPDGAEHASGQESFRAQRPEKKPNRASEQEQASKSNA